MLRGAESWIGRLQERRAYLEGLPVAARKLAEAAGMGLTVDEAPGGEPIWALQMADLALACDAVEEGLAWADLAVSGISGLQDPDLLCLAVLRNRVRVMVRPEGLQPRLEEEAWRFGGLARWPRPGAERSRLVLAGVACEYLQGEETSPLTRVRGREGGRSTFAEVETASLAMTPLHLAAYWGSAPLLDLEVAEPADDDAVASLELGWARRVAMLRAHRTSWKNGRTRARLMDWPMIAVLVGRLERGLWWTRPAANADVEHLRSVAVSVASSRQAPLLR